MLVVDGMDVAVTRRAGQKRAYIRVKEPDGRVEVSAPMRMADAAIARFVREHAGWIESRTTRGDCPCSAGPGRPDA